MSHSPETLKQFGATVQRLIEGMDLSREETYACFREILDNRQPELQQGAFLAALTAKGETPQEIAGAWQAIAELDTVRTAETFDGPVVENSGTGMDALKTFNVSTAASIIAAAGGVRLARHGARGITSSCGTVDVLDLLGIHVDCAVDDVCRSIREVGIGLFNGMSPQVHPRALFRILGSIRFGSTLNISASLASPCRPTHALRGVYRPDLVEKTAAVLKEIGYQRGMVVYGWDASSGRGMDELSTLGESLICEFDASGQERPYRLTPEEAGLRRACYEDVAALGDPQREAVRLLQVLAGQGHEACGDLACLNAGAIFYLTGLCASIRDGVTRSRELLASGKALEKLNHWLTVQQDVNGNGLDRYRDLASRAGIAA